jgi:hypothetical protein
MHLVAHATTASEQRYDEGWHRPMGCILELDDNDFIYPNWLAMALHHMIQQKQEFFSCQRPITIEQVTCQKTHCSRLTKKSYTPASNSIHKLRKL